MNSNKIPAELQGIVQHSQLFGRAKDLCKTISSEEMASIDGAQKIFKAVHKRDSLAVVTEIYGDFLTLLNTKRGENESYRNFESRFEAQVNKFNSRSTSTKLPESLLAFMLLANANIDGNQRIRVLASGIPRASDESSMDTEELLNNIVYSSIASVVRQCETPITSRTEQYGSFTGSSSSLQSNSVSTSSAPTKKKFSPSQLARLKSKSKCRKCGKFGHWESDHNADGTINEVSKPADTGNNNSNQEEKYKKNTVTFNMVTPSSVNGIDHKQLARYLMMVLHIAVLDSKSSK